MWKLGFSFWRAGYLARFAVPAGLVLGVVALTQGMSTLFWTLAVVFGAIYGGMVAALNAFEERETGVSRRSR